MKTPFLNAGLAFIYIILIVLLINTFGRMMIPDNILIPIVMLSLFVLSAAIMGFFFLNQPFMLFMEGKKAEALRFFIKTVLIFGFFVVAATLLLLKIGLP